MLTLQPWEVWLLALVALGALGWLLRGERPMRPTYDQIQAGAQRVTCAVCGQVFDATHATRPYVCVACRGQGRR